MNLIIESLNNVYSMVPSFQTSKVIYILIVLLISWTFLRIIDRYYINKSFLRNLNENSIHIASLVHFSSANLAENQLNLVGIPQMSHAE